MKSEPCEGDQSYLFISYSHQDVDFLHEITALFDKEGIRYWFDSGMYAGAYWRKVITEHLKNASGCLFLCTENSCRSDNVLDELAFAKSYRIILMTLIDGTFEVNDEIKLMTGRTHWTIKQSGYEKELLRGIPVEVYRFTEKAILPLNHPLYEIKQELLKEKGMVISLGIHRTLGYQVKIMNDSVKSEDAKETWDSVSKASKLHHPQFPVILDRGNR